MKSKFALCLILGATFFNACRDEAATNSQGPITNKDDLIGRWEISKGFRNGKEIETLVGTYYIFTQEGEMKTNLTPTSLEQTYNYTFKDNTIKQEGEPAIDFTVDSLSAEYLELSMVINNFPFRLEMKKALPPAELEASDTSKQDSLEEL